MSNGLTSKRRTALHKYIVRNKKVRISDLAETFGVSNLTIRRDLEVLEQQGDVIRGYGFAQVAHDDSQNVSIGESDVKKRIARAAAELIEDNDVIFINTSSTAVSTLRYIEAHNVTVITNNGVAPFVNHSQSIRILLAGGEVHPPKYSLTGDLTLEFFARVRAGKCIVGCDGLSIDGGLTTNAFNEMQANREMLEHSLQRIVVASSNKLGVVGSFQSASIDLIDTLVTDTGIEEVQSKLFQVAGLQRVVRA